MNMFVRLNFNEKETKRKEKKIELPKGKYWTLIGQLLL